MAVKKKASGKSVPEAQRHTARVVLRLPPDVAEEIRVQARFAGVSASELVARAWRAYVDP